MPRTARPGAAAPPETGPAHFAQRLVDWQRAFGRHDLPWQVRDPYRVWLSEIMLQQTQVSVVMGYFARFTARFPTVQALAAAPQDAVLAAWSGLGYYRRARYLHQCAQQVVQRYGGRFPSSAAELATLPGIGPSTAAAIAAFCFDERAAILDGNVQRVLCRSHGIADPLPSATTSRRLWALARALLPEADAIAAYTQGLMDLGATVCKPRQPACEQCPFAADCQARRSGDPQRLPVRAAAARARPVRHTVMLWLHQPGRDDCWLEQRGHDGVWPGLWSLPLFDSQDLALAYAARHGSVLGLRALAPFRHGFTHFELVVQPLQVALLPQPHAAENAATPGQWVARSEAAQRGLPAPVRKLLGRGLALQDPPQQALLE